MEDFPVYGDEVMAQTWSEGFTSPLVANRNFLFYKNGKICGKATTRWILLDLASGRPSRIDPAYLEKYGTEDKTVFEDKKLNIDTFNKKSSITSFLTAIGLIVVSNFLIALFSTPDANNEFIEQCLENKRILRYFAMMIVIALIPAICEEWFFRAGLQKIFISWSRNTWVGIILASCIFSMFHGDFANFIPRAVLGFVLGILYHYSNNIWVNISAHFFNNGLIVTAYFFHIDFLLEENNSSPTLSSYLLAGLALLAIAAFIYYNEAKRKQNTIEK